MPVDRRQLCREIFPTGLAPLDEAMAGGLIAGRLYGFGARYKRGKTLLLGTISHNLNHAGVPHLYACLEMSPDEIEERNVAREMGFNAIKFLTRDMPDLERRTAEYVATIPSRMIYKHMPGATLRRLKRGRSRRRAFMASEA